LVEQFSFKSWENPLYETLHAGGLGFTVLDKLAEVQRSAKSWEERVKV
jgi:hypothetical protein